MQKKGKKKAFRLNLFQQQVSARNLATMPQFTHPNASAGPAEKAETASVEISAPDAARRELRREAKGDSKEVSSSMTWTICRGEALGAAAVAALSALVDLATTFEPSRWAALRIEEEDRILQCARGKRCRSFSFCSFSLFFLLKLFLFTSSFFI